MPDLRIVRSGFLMLVIALLLSVSAVPATSAVIRDATSATTVIHNTQDRELTSITFQSSTTVMTGVNFLLTNDGYLFNGASLYRWTNEIGRDISTSGNNYLFNPDRADLSSVYSGEPTPTARLNEVFGSFNGYKNMSWILDGEQSNTDYFVDLYFSNGIAISGDSDNSTMELAILERGANSSFRVRGILDKGTGTTLATYNPVLTNAPIMVSDSQGPFTSLWSLDTLEIESSQPVIGYGISIDPNWQNIIGIRIENLNQNYNGPDIVAVGVVPEPGAAVLLSVGAIVLLYRRRRIAKLR